MYYYTVYDKKDNVIASGNAAECAKTMGLTIGSFYCAVDRSAKGRNKKYVFVKDEL